MKQNPQLIWLQRLMLLALTESFWKCNVGILQPLKRLFLKKLRTVKHFLQWVPAPPLLSAPSGGLCVFFSICLFVFFCLCLFYLFFFCLFVFVSFFYLSFCICVFLCRHRLFSVSPAVGGIFCGSGRRLWEVLLGGSHWSWWVGGVSRMGGRHWGSIPTKIYWSSPNCGFKHHKKC